MPFDPYGARPGFRYIADPLGRLGFGRTVAERELPDPFGRLPAPARPDPEIMDLGDPLAIGDSVGMAGRNSRRDVARIESLLGRAGAIDLAATDGVTGYFGARTDETVRKFQKDHGLEVDGLINPDGPTLKALVARLRGDSGAAPFVAREKNPAPPMSERPPVDPRQETVRRMVERLLYQRRQGADPLSFGAPATRLAEAEPASAGDNKGDAGKDGASPVPTPPPPRPGEPQAPKTGRPVPDVPAYRKDAFAGQEQAWEEFNREAGKLPGITETEKTVLSDIFAAEGGMRKDPNSSAASGILQETLDRAKARGKVPGIGTIDKPSDLTVGQRAAVMRDYFDDTLRTVGGSEALDAIGDTRAAGALADTIYRHGRKGGTEIVQEAVNKVREERGESPIDKDGQMGPVTLSAFRDLAADEKTRDALIDRLGKIRKSKSVEAEEPRIDFSTFGTRR